MDEHLERRHRHRFSLAIALIAALAALVVAGCGGSDSSDEGGDSSASSDSASGKPIVIGAVKAQSGFMEAFDTAPLNAAKLAAEQFNEAGGIEGRPVEIKTSDYHTKLDDVGPAAQELLSEGAEILIVACDFDFAAPAMLAAQAEKKVAISDCAGAAQAGDPKTVGPYAYTMANPGQSEGAVMAEFGAKKLGVKNAWTLRDPSLAFYQSALDGFTQRFEELGGKIAARETVDPEDPSISAQISDLKALNPTPDVLFITVGTETGSGVIRQLRAAGFDQPILTTSTYDGDYWKEAVPKQALSNVYFQTYGSIFGDDPDPKVNEFVKRMEKKTGPLDTAFAMTGYSLMQLIKEGVEAAGTTAGPELAKAIDDLPRVKLLVGPTDFSSDLHVDPTREQRVMEINNGKSRFKELWKLQEPPDLGLEK